MLQLFPAFGETSWFSMVFQNWPLAGEAGFGRLGGWAGGRAAGRLQADLV